MGKAWDGWPTPQAYQRWCLAWAQEVFRVMKPGAHLLAFGGTRTYHRLTCGLEDAGFEIRDSLRDFVSGAERPAPNAWIYGQGFPKSRDIGKAIDKLNGKPLDQLRDFGVHVRAARERAGLTQAEVNRAMQMPQGCGWWEGKGAGAKWDLHLPSWATYQRLKPLIGLNDSFDWLIEWAEAEREVIGKGISGRTAIWADDGMGDYNLTAPATPEAQRWHGWGTALKPSFEPIVLARKPLAGNVAGNVLAYGTGGLNIDGCRVGTESTRRPTGDHSFGKDAGWNAHNLRNILGGSDSGRWPPNTLLSHAEGCVEVGTRRVKGAGHFPAQNNVGLGTPAGIYGTSKPRVQPERHMADPDGTETVPAWSCQPGCPVAELDRQSGVRASGGSRHERSTVTQGIYGQFTPGRNDAREPDTGGASRFFPTFKYTAKADRAERPVGDHGEQHPTVKPLDLMRWLVRLITPPGGIILDPFCGSGPTLEAALIEGFRSIGLDSDPTAVHLTAKRLAKPIPLTFGFDL